MRKILKVKSQFKMANQYVSQEKKYGKKKQTNKHITLDPKIFIFASFSICI